MLKHINKWLALKQGTSCSRRWPVIIAVLALALIALYVMRIPHSSSFMRGKQIAQESGCSGCHEGNRQNVFMNPGTLRGVIPNFHSEASASLFWVENKAEFAEWVKQGVSNRIKTERARFNQQNTNAIIMPAYGSKFSATQLDDLYTYFLDKNSFPVPVDDAAGRGGEVAEKYGCFACHGMHGLDGNANPASFKGYIPPWEGEDFNELARNDDEIKEWIQHGQLQRFDSNPFAQYFLRKQKIKMPAYKNMTDDEIRDITAYIHWLPQRRELKKKLTDIQAANKTLPESLFNRSGCTTCHKPSGAEGFIDRQGKEMPSRQRLASRLKTLSAIIAERETQARWQKTALCSYYASFYQEYNRIHQIIKNGKNKEGDDQLATLMPAWQARANPDFSSDTDEDIDNVITSLLMENPRVTEQQVVQWQANGKSCPQNSPALHIKNSPARRNEIINRIEKLDAEKKIFSQAPSLMFLSNEASLFDIVGFYSESDIDYWLLRQYPTTITKADVHRRKNSDAFPADKRYVIAVDKSAPVYKAYFFLTEAQFDFNNPPAYLKKSKYTDAGVAGCFSCHMSGPRKLRPLQREGIRDLEPEDQIQLKHFNDRIISYGAVETVWPENQPKPDAHQLEPLTDEVCKACHSSDSVRAPILRYHQKAVKTLFDTGELDSGFILNLDHPHESSLTAMPPVAPVPAAVKTQILDWIAR